MSASPTGFLYRQSATQGLVMMRTFPVAARMCCLVAILACSATLHAEEIDFEHTIAPILKTYCAGCHNDADREGKLSLASLASLRAGTPDGPVVVPANPSASKLLQVLAENAENKMPPKGEPQLTDQHKKLIEAWIAAGAKGDAKQPSTSNPLKTPSIPQAPLAQKRVTAVCSLSDGQFAVGRFGTVEARDAEGAVRWVFDQVPGKVNQLRATPDGKSLIIAGGNAGVAGEVLVLNAATGQIQSRLQGHRDSIYCASASADGRWIASGSYDRSVLIWDRQTGKVARALTGHNGPIYDLDFDATSSLLATASGDQTVKIWSVNGERLDTLGQPQGEVLSVRFSPGGNHIFAAGADRQIRKWQLVSRREAAINPLLVARFAHEDDCCGLEFLSPDVLVSCSVDRTVKLWDTQQLKPLGQLATLVDVPVGFFVSSNSLRAFSLDGNQAEVDISQYLAAANQASSLPANRAVSAGAQIAPALPIMEATEVEPNGQLAQANQISLPARLKGTIDAGQGDAGDCDLYRFTAKAGQRWIFEVSAARNGSPLDSRVEILDENGRPVLQTRLQATRESYLTFRGKDSSTSDDFRVHNWEDMELNEYLYTEGEIVKLWLYPRGPDSGFKVYPGFGARFTYFNSTPTAHALGTPAYIVRELVGEEEPLPNGLPVFDMFAENDDDGLRRHGKDSRLVFTVPRDGNYIAKIRDARDFGGSDFHYQLDVRTPRPDFEIKVGGNKLKMPVGVGREWQITATRLDGLSGPIAVELQGLPEGFLATNPLVIESEQLVAYGTIFATPAALEANRNEDGTPKSRFDVTLIARSEHERQKIEHQLTEKLEVELDTTAELNFKLLDATADREIDEITIRPGQTVSARIRLDRAGTSGPISFGREDSGRNLPHGTIVDNIGLNGLLIPDGMTEREFFITASRWLPPQRRQFHLRCESKGNATSRPIWLNVVP